MPFLVLDQPGKSRSSDAYSHLKLPTSVPRFPSSQTWVFPVTDVRRLFLIPQTHFLSLSHSLWFMQTLLSIIFTPFLPHFHHPLFCMVFLNLINWFKSFLSHWTDLRNNCFSLKKKPDFLLFYLEFYTNIQKYVLIGSTSPPLHSMFSPTPPITFPSQPHVLSPFKPTESTEHCLYMHEYRTTYRTWVDLWGQNPEKTGSPTPRSQHLPTAPQLGLGLHEPLPWSYWDFGWLDAMQIFCKQFQGLRAPACQSSATPNKYYLTTGCILFLQSF